MNNKLQLGILLFFLCASLFAQENSIDFDGTNDYVNCGNNGSLNITGNTITLEAWIYPTSFKAQVWAGNVINKNGAGDNGYMLRVGNGGQVNFNLGTGWWNEINSATGVVTLNNWHHIAGTYDGTTMRLYVDGVQVAAGAENQNIGSASNSLYLGEDPQWTGRNFPGRIEEVRIWNTARTATEVAEDMATRTCAPFPASLVAYYRFNQGTANANNAGLTTVNDETGTNNGTLTNSSLNGTSSNWVDGLVRNCPANMTYVSSTTTQNNTSGVSICGSAAANQEIIGLEVVTTGSLNPIDLTHIRLWTDGSTDPLNDISNIDVYYTGTSSTFATTTLYGSGATIAPGNNRNINALTTLAEGTNYFWIVYDVPATATIGNNLDALIQRVRVDGLIYVPTVTTPAGNRPIAGCPGDEPCTAYSITVGCSGIKVDGDNTGMTNSGIAAPSCGSYVSGDVWYTLVVPASGIVKVEAYAGTLTDAAMAIYSVSGGCSGTLTEVACDDNSGFGNMPKITLTGQTPGNTLYIRVWDPANNQTGTFEIDAADLSSDYCVTGNGIDQGNGCAQLTSATNGQLGSIWDADDKLDFTADWTYDFTVNLGNNDAGADGVCFVIQNAPGALTTTGISGGSMGAGGITNSLIVEIDTYWNTEDRNDGIAGSACSGGTSPDHLDIWLNGDVNPGNCTTGARYVPNAVELLNGGVSYNIENGLDHILRISYIAGTQTLTATTLNAAGTITYGTISYSPVDPMALFGTNAPYFGFTASTGGLNNQQSACLAASLILPIELANFDVTCDDEGVQLNWVTLSEINNDYFTIERSIDGINFEPIGTVNGAGNISYSKNYSWVEENPLSVVAYYRLKQTDFNGEYSYSKTVATECESNNTINVYPNPTNGIFTFDYFTNETESLTMVIHNMAGKLILKKTYSDFPEGNSSTSVNIDGLSDGIYYVKFTTSSKQFIHKLSVVK